MTFKEPMKHPLEYKSFGVYNKNYVNELKRYNSIKKSPVINRCNCGKEWEDKELVYQEGCNPYVENQCKECSEREIKEELEKEKKTEDKKNLEMFENQVPLRFKNQLTNVVHSELLEACCSVIWGSFGTGKTWESLTVAKELIINRKIKNFRFVTEMGILLDLQDGFEERRNKIDQYAEYDLLIIDESGKIKDTDYNNGLMYEIINRRYNNMKRTIMIFNAKTKDQVKEVLSSASQDRFRECIVEMNGKSKRYSK